MPSKEAIREANETAMRFHREDMARRRLCITTPKMRQKRGRVWCGKGLTRYLDEKSIEQRVSVSKEKR